LTGIHQKLAAIFQGEHAEHLEQIRSILALLASVAETKGRSEIDEAFRRAHSLKGAARAVDLEAVEKLASGLETLFSRVREGTMVLDQRMTRVIHQVLEASEECVEALREDRIPEQPAAALLAMEDLLGIETAGIAAGPTTARPAASPPTEPRTELRSDMVRMPVENVDRLVRATSRILTESLQQASVAGELDALDGQIAELVEECVRFRRASAAHLWRLGNQPECSSIIRHIGFAEKRGRFLAALSIPRLHERRHAPCPGIAFTFLRIPRVR
jgi:two-component system chemotaxis sensor kinase CheA